jgi:hypothetical protein
MSGFPRVANFFGEVSATPTPTASPTPIAITSNIPTPAASETTGHPGRKTAKQARAASANAAAASKEAATASAAAAAASKQTASVANQIEGSGRTNTDVSLESNPGGPPADASRSSVSGRQTPSSTPSAAASRASFASVTRGTPPLSSSALESSGSAAEGNPEKAAKLIQDIDKIEKRVDRKNLSADDSQRDILAQKLVQEAKKALAEHDSVAAISLATKASTLLAPLPKLADSDIPSAP